MVYQRTWSNQQSNRRSSSGQKAGRRTRISSRRLGKNPGVDNKKSHLVKKRAGCDDLLSGFQLRLFLVGATRSLLSGLWVVNSNNQKHCPTTLMISTLFYHLTLLQFNFNSIAFKSNRNGNYSIPSSKRLCHLKLVIPRASWKMKTALVGFNVNPSAWARRRRYSIYNDLIWRRSRSVTVIAPVTVNSISF